MKLRVILTANAGVCIHFGGKSIWVDALHDRKVLGFSPVSDSVLDEIWKHEAFQSPDLICYTHRHPDHYSREMTLEASRRWPEAVVIAPDVRDPDWENVTGERWTYHSDDLTLAYVRLPHEGAAFADTVHYGILLTSGQDSVLIPGDCRLCDPAVLSAVQGKHIYAALLDFPWITLPKPRRFVTEMLRPEHMIIYHLPFAQDDVNHYRDAAGKACSRMNENVRLLMEPLQEIML